MALFGLEKAAIAPLVSFENAIRAGFATGAAIGIITPLTLMTKWDLSLKYIWVGTGTASAAMWAGVEISGEKRRKVAAKIEEAQHKALGVNLKNQALYHDAVSLIEAKNRTVLYVGKNTPQFQWKKWSEKLGLDGLMPPPEQFQSSSGQPEAIALNDQSDLDEVGSAHSTIDYSWLDEDFIRASKAVFGAKGSGKTTYLNYEAMMFLATNPNGELRIGDLHFDPEEPKWLPSVPSEVLLKKYVASKKESILALFRWFHAELKDRIDKGDRIKPGQDVVTREGRTRRRVKFICDEFIGFIGRCSNEEIKEIEACLATSQDEGRKFGMDVTLGLHSLKKGRSKIDSSVLFQMDILCLANAIADPNTPFPTDWDKKALVSCRHAVQASLGPGQGFACVACKQGDPPIVQVLPHIDLSNFKIGNVSAASDLPNQSAADETPKPTDIFGQLKTWVELVQGQEQRNPTDEELSAAWQELTGKAINYQGLRMLKERLGLGK